MNALTGPELTRIEGAILLRFEPAEFEQLIAGMGRRLEDMITPADDYEGAVHRVCAQAHRDGWLPDLLRAMSWGGAR